MSLMMDKRFVELKPIFEDEDEEEETEVIFVPLKPIPSDSIQESMKRTSNEGDDDDEPEKVMKLDDQVDNGGDATPMETMPMTKQSFQLPPKSLPLILTHLAHQNSLGCRRVHSTWKVFMDPIILAQRSFKIHFTGQEEEYYSTSQKKISYLPWFIDCLEDSEKFFGTLNSFPCVQFKFSYSSLEEKNVQNFLNLFGPFIQSLQLDHVQVSVEDGHLKSLSRLLTLQAPNLRHLDLHIESETMPTVLFEDKETKLPHLNTLDQRSLTSNLDRTILKEILGAANNLKGYNLESGFQNPDQLDVFMSTGKVESLKNIQMKINQRDIQLWEKFGDGLPRLECLKIFLHSSQHPPELLSRASAIINKILQSSQDSLTTLDFLSQPDPIEGIFFPVLKKVKCLRMNCHFSTIFLHGQSLSTTFPKVDEINLDLFGVTAIFWDNFTQNNLPSVHTLKIYNFENGQGIPQLFPNLKELVLMNPKLNFVRQIFVHMKGELLDTLELFGLDCSLPGNGYPALDSVLTGFSPDTCLRLAKCRKMVLDDGEIEKLRKNPSILQLTGLTTLKITGVRRLDDLIVSPRVSARWAFQKMSQLKVIITAYRFGDDPDQILQCNTALNTVAPYVHAVGFSN